jgi:telomerase reverse transcriptase
MLLGKAGERIMIDLLLDGAVFTAVEAGRGNLYQLSGVHISSLKTLAAISATNTSSASGTNDAGKPSGSNPLSPCEISFVKSRMLYARAALNARGSVQFGLRHIRTRAPLNPPSLLRPLHRKLGADRPLDALNRFPRKPMQGVKERAPGDEDESEAQRDKQDVDDDSTTRIMLYMFPRQFGLHNVFTSPVDRKQTAQKFQDYTLREEEIAAKFGKKPKDDKDGDGKKAPNIYVPKRLKGKAQHLVQRLQVLHGRCAYSEMIRHYCPVCRWFRQLFSALFRLTPQQLTLD